jgi:ABC-2 type transport system ATP-binding protein
MDILIEALHLTKTFGHTIAVDDLNLSVAAGEIYGLVGPDGAGKTTAMRLLCGALRPTWNKARPVAVIRIAGFELNKQTEQAREQIGYLPQRFSLYEELTVLENIRFFAETRGLSASQWRPRCMEILEFVGLAEFTGRRAGQLSGGMKQKLGLAAALVHQPRVLLLDEPTTGVDPVTRQDFWQLIIHLASSPPAASTPSVAVLVSTPYMDEAARCARVGIIRQGRILVEGAPAELCAGLQQNILELRGNPLALLRRLVEAEEDVEGAQMFGDRLHLRVSSGKSEQVISRLEQRIPQAGGEISLLRPVPAQLEDVFIALLEDSENTTMDEGRKTKVTRDS